MKIVCLCWGQVSRRLKENSEIIYFIFFVVFYIFLNFYIFDFNQIKWIFWLLTVTEINLKICFIYYVFTVETYSKYSMTFTKKEYIFVHYHLLKNLPQVLTVKSSSPLNCGSLFFFLLFFACIIIIFKPITYWQCLSPLADS